MKKYIAPSLQVVNIQNENILAGSEVRMGTYSDQTLLGRGHRGTVNDFDDDED